MAESKLLRQEERNGEIINVYESGAEYNLTRGHLVKPAAGTVIRSPEKATALNRKRKEKMQRLTRARLVETHNGVMPNPVRSSAAAFAEALAMLWEQVVLNSEAYPRDRKEVLDMVAKYADLQPADMKEQAEDTAALLNAAASAANAEAAATLLRVLEDVQKIQQGKKPDTIEGRVIE